MKTLQKNPAILTALIAFMWLFFDVLSKKWAVLHLSNPRVFIDSFFYLKPVQENAGIAFGLPVPMIVQIVGSIAIIAVLIVLAKEQLAKGSKERFAKAILFGIILGGAFGNLTGRIAQGYVLDFIVLKPFPVFNIADIGITVGLIALFVLMLLEHKK